VSAVLSPLDHAYQTQRRRLSTAVTVSAAAIWARLYHDRGLFVMQTVQVVAAGQRHTVALVDAYMAAKMLQATGAGTVKGLDPALYTIAALRGVPADVVYGRPFGALGAELAKGADQAQAVDSGLAALTKLAATDLQLAQTNSARDWMSSEDTIVGWRRVTDGNPCELCGLAATRTYRKEDLMPIHEHCVTGDSVVSAGLVAPASGSTQTSDLRAAHATTRRWYSGHLVILETATGHELSVTPNHPILTSRGWVAAGLLREGDSVIRSLRSDGVVGHIPHEEDMPTRIEERFRSDAVRSLVAVPFATEKFHGDAGDGEVDVVTTDRRLHPWLLAALLEPTEHLLFAAGTRATLAAGLCREHERFLARRTATLTRMGGSNASPAPLSTPLLVDEVGLFADRAHRDAALYEMPSYGRAADVEDAREFSNRLAGHVTLDSIRHQRRIDWSGHVFNLVTSEGWYTANAIVTHNCGCTVEPLWGTHAVGSVGTTVRVENDPELGPRLMADSWSPVGPRLIA